MHRPRNNKRSTEQVVEKGASAVLDEVEAAIYSAALSIMQGMPRYNCTIMPL